MKGKLLTLSVAEIIVPKDEANPTLGTFKVEVKLQEPEINLKMIGVDLNFSLKIPCIQFCGSSKKCSQRNEKICEEATVSIMKDSTYWNLNKQIYSSSSGLDTDEPGLYS